MREKYNYDVYKNTKLKLQVKYTNTSSIVPNKTGVDVQKGGRRRLGRRRKLPRKSSGTNPG